MANFLKSSNKVKKGIIIPKKKNRSITIKSRSMSKKVRSIDKKVRSKGKIVRQMSKKSRSKGKKIRTKLSFRKYKLTNKSKNHQYGGDVEVEFKDIEDNTIKINPEYKKITAGAYKIIFLPTTEDKVIAIELITSHKKNEELINERVISDKMSSAGIGPKIYYSNTCDLSHKDNETSLKKLFGGKNKLDKRDYEAAGRFVQAYNNIFSPENESSSPEIKLLAITIMMKLDNFRDHCFYPSLANNIQTMWGVDSKSRQFDSKILTEDECKQIFKTLKTKFNTLWDQYHIAHHDINHNNLMYKRHPDGKVEGFIIDWGWAKDYSKTGEDAYKKEFDYQGTGVVGEDFLKLFRGKGDGDAFRLKPGFRYHEL